MNVPVAPPRYDKVNENAYRRIIAERINGMLRRLTALGV